MSDARAREALYPPASIFFPQYLISFGITSSLYFTHHLCDAPTRMLELAAVRPRSQNHARHHSPTPRFASIPRESLLFGPSPIHLLDHITADLGAECKVCAKRDDCCSALAFGGNKTRKLEYVIADALAAGADTLVSVGGVQSNHTRQVAAVAAKYGLKVSKCSIQGQVVELRVFRTEYRRTRPG
jgi:Pyridoxal-phosphate dependent enzyme